MTYLPFEKYLIEQGFAPDHGCDNEFNVSYNPEHRFVRENESIKILFRMKWYKDNTMKDCKEVLYTVRYWRKSQFESFFVMPTEPADFKLLLENKLPTILETLFPV